MDYILFGFTTPVIGTFSINLSDYFKSKVNIGMEMLSPKTKFKFYKPGFTQSFCLEIPEKPESISESEEAHQDDEVTETSGLLSSTLSQKHQKSHSAGLREVLFTSLQKQNSSFIDLDGMTVHQARKGNFVIYPNFKEDPILKRMVEVDKPDSAKFMPIGYSRTPGDKMLHYRYYLKTELESSIFIEPSPFHFFNLTRGKKTLFDWGHLKPEERVEITGKFKGLIRVSPLDSKITSEIQLKRLRRSKRRVSQYLKANSFIPEDYQLLDVPETHDFEQAEAEMEFKEISRQLLIKIDVVVTVYIIDAFDITSLDFGSDSDPYLILKLGDKVINEKDKFISNTSDPKFYSVHTLRTTLPGESNLKIQLWDRDPVLKDDKIGSTSIDLEDRFCSIKWNKLPFKPIETRKLIQKSCSHPRGYIRLWVDIRKEEEMSKLTDISPRPPAEYEARLIIYRTEGVPAGDVEDTSDLYIRAWVNESKPKETDTHYRCRDGKGSWNWRMKFNITLPSKLNVVNLQVWDKDVFSRNDFLADAAIEFDDLAEIAFGHELRIKKYEVEKGIMGFKNREEKIWVPLKAKDKEGNMIKAGRLQVSFELLPIEKAKACIVGEGRDEPNVDPYLAPPIGRFEWSLNPFSLISQTCGPEFQRKICLFICCLLYIMILVLIFPMVISTLIATAASNVV